MKTMTASMMMALHDSKHNEYDLNEIGFILTVLRDNTSDDYVYNVLNNIIKNAI